MLLPDCMLSMDLSARRYTVGEAVILADFIRGNRAVTEFDLSDNSFGGFLRNEGTFKQAYAATPAAVSALAHALKENKTLRTLKLKNTQLSGNGDPDKHGFLSLMTTFKFPETKLTELDLSQNTFSNVC